MQEQQTGGTIKIADDVVATITAIAISETPGIASMSGGLSDEFARRISGKSGQKGISVEVGATEAAIDLRVIVEYGSKIHEVCRLLQSKVKDAVESMTGLKTVEINVKVEGIAFKDEPLPEVDK